MPSEIAPAEIAPYIERLLFHNDTVVLPGIGAFVAQEAPSSIDYAGGTVSPPAKVLTFNDYLTTDDGLLTYELVQERNISDQDAKAWVDERIVAIMGQLNQREIVALPGIGRLYKNYVQRIQFLPDAANFSRENFGLPPLQFSPLARSREVVGTPAPGPSGGTAASTTTTPNTTSPTHGSVPLAQSAEPTPAPSFGTPPPASQQWMRGMLILGLLVLSGAIGYYFLRMQQQKNMAKKDQQEQLTENTPPSTEQTTDNTTTEVPTTSAPTTTPKTEPKPKAEVAPVAEQPKPAPTPSTKAKDKNCVLLVGMFKDPANIARLKTLFQKNGFEVYSSETSSGATSLGVQFKYADQSEVNANIAKLQKLTGEKNIRVRK